MSLEREIKFIALNWANSGGSHSDDLLEEILDALRTSCGWTPRDIRGEAFDVDHVAILRAKTEYSQEFYGVTDEEWEAWLTEGKMTYNMRQWASTFFVEDEMLKEVESL